MNSIGDFLDLVTLNENKTDGKTVFGYETYALQIQKLDPLEFKGQTFTVDLGSVADTMNITQIKENELITSEVVMSAISNATASVSISRDLVNGRDNCQSEASNSSQQRLSYSVFLSDILFQSLNQSQFKVGSIILSARLNCLANDSEFLSSPIQTTFRTHSQVCTYLLTNTIELAILSSMLSICRFQMTSVIVCVLTGIRVRDNS